MAISELGSRVESHDRLDVRVDELGNTVPVQARVLSSLKLILVNVTIVVADCRGHESFGHELREGDHLRAHVNQSLLVGVLDELGGAGAKESSLVERTQVELELLEAEVSELGHHDLLEVGTAQVLRVDILAGAFVNDVDQVSASHFIDLNREKFILFFFLWCLGFAQSLEDVEDEGSGASGKRSLDVVRVEELGHVLRTTLAAEELPSFAKVGKEFMRLLALSDLGGLFEKHAR